MPNFEEQPTSPVEDKEGVENKPEQVRQEDENDPKGKILELMTPDGSKKCEIVGQKDPGEGEEFGSVIVQVAETGVLMPMDPTFIAEQLQVQKGAEEQAPESEQPKKMGVGQWDLKTGENLMNREPTAEEQAANEAALAKEKLEADARGKRNQEIQAQAQTQREDSLVKPSGISAEQMAEVQRRIAAEKVKQATEPDQPQEQPKKMGVGQWDLKTGENLMNREPTAEEQAANEAALAKEKLEAEARGKRNQEILSQTPEKKVDRPVKFIDMEKVRKEMAAQREVEQPAEQPEQTQEVVKADQYKAGDTIMAMSRSLGKEVPWKVISDSPKEGYSVSRQMVEGGPWSAPRTLTQNEISGKITANSAGSEDIRGTMAA